MKSKLIGLFMLVSLIGFSQSVPNTTTFTLQNVYDVVHSHTPATAANLSSCFTNANASYFDATYSGTKTNLLNFRNYTVASAAVPPTVTTTAPSGVTYTVATIGGNCTSDGGATITARGTYVSTNSNMSGAVAVTNSGQTGAFSDTYTNPCTGTTYYFQAYATNSAGTGTGSILSYTSSSPTLVQFSFYSRIDGVDITDATTASQCANKLYWSILGDNQLQTRYTVAMTTSDPVYDIATNPSCRWFTNVWKVAKNNSNGNIYIVYANVNSIMTTCTQYTATVNTYTTSATWTKPANVSYIQVECWGGGGTGGVADGTGARAAGGSGGTYAKKVVNVTGNVSYTVATAATATNTSQVNGNNTFFGAAFGTALVAANGGVGGAVNTSTGGATATTAVTTGSIGTTIYAGGNGGAGTSAGYAGGGGGGAGSTGAGNNATNETAGTAKSENGGAGGAGTNSSNTSNPGSTYGGGGSGGLAGTATNRAGGNGAAGLIRITY